ncbi:chondroitin proteoglycan-2-like [Daphnia carinata]|uniref:chondroitin proteoglycan-2-like n=1 Tax=Daphnia carinata TaxID=120202 RepID=UPI0028694D6C|nr:chondroitin proteoglycan-2-like [Daphnia carinata]
MKKFVLLSLLLLGFSEGSFGKSFKGSAREDCNYPTIFDPATNLATLSLRIPNKQGRESEFQCPNSDTDFFPADPFCSEFYYVCVDGIAYPQECPGTSGITAFDPATKTCRPVECCRCYFTCPASDPNGFFPVPGTCSSGYYVCVDGLYETYECPLGALFDPVTGDCEPPAEASCNQPFSCPSTDGVFPYPDACSSIYYNCTNGQDSIQYCPTGTVFDPAVSSCVTTAYASCSPGATTTEVSTTTEGVFVCLEAGYFPIPENCSIYYLCRGAGEAPLTVPCPNGLVFNPDTALCDYPENVPECSITAAVELLVGGNVRLGISKQDHPGDGFSCKNEDGIYPLKSDGSYSRYYFACVGGIAYPKVCPGMTAFDSGKLSCALIA